MRVAIYARVSTKEQSDYGTSLQTQLQSMRQWVYDHGYTIVTEESEDFTGTAYNRPGINRLKAMANDGELDALLVYSRDRYARSRLAGLMLDMAFKHVELLYVTREKSEDTPQGMIRDGLDDLMHEYEVANIQERTMRGKRKRIGDGRLFASGNLLYGYKRVKYDNDRNTDLAIDDTTVISDIEALATPSHVVRYCFYRIAYDRIDVAQLTQELNAYGIRTSYGKQWTRERVYHMLTHIEYTGRFYYFRQQQILNEQTGKRTTVVRPEEEWVSVVREDLRLIGEETWQAVQDKFASGRGKKMGYEYLMSRRVTCEHGHKMSGESKSISLTNPTKRLYYRCTHKTCPINTIRAADVDAAVWQWVIQLTQDPDKVLQGYRDAQATAIEDTQDARGMIEACDRLIAQTEDELSYLIEEAKQFRNNQRIREQYRHQIGELSKKLDLLEDEKRNQTERLSSHVLSDSDIAYYVDTVTTLSIDTERLETLEFTVKRELIEILGISVILGEDDQGIFVDVVWYGSIERLRMNMSSSAGIALHTPLQFRLRLNAA